MVAVGDYVDFLTQLKPNPSKLVATGLMGDASPVTVSINADTGASVLEPSCTGSGGDALPPVRLMSFFDSLPLPSLVGRVCYEELAAPLILTAAYIRTALSPACLDGAVYDADPGLTGIQPNCVVEAQLVDGTVEELPFCNDRVEPNDSTNQPCWLVFDDPDFCGDTETKLAIRRFPADYQLPIGSSLKVSCLVD